MNKEKMSTSYKIAQEMIKDKLRDVDENMADKFDDLNTSDIIVSSGKYDSIERVFSGMDINFKVIEPYHFEIVDLDPGKIVFMNCPGEVTNKGLKNLVDFVDKGGFLFTTDWALKHVIEPGFPGYIEYNNQPTLDEVVRVKILTGNDPFLQSLLGPNDDPQWWLEESSFPIRIINKKKVEVLVKSQELEDKYGESPVFVSFDYGKGKVYHMISHFYLQRAETRSSRHEKGGAEYTKEKLMMDDYRTEKYKSMEINKANLSDVEAAYSSSTIINKILWDKKNINDKEERYDEKF